MNRILLIAVFFISISFFSDLKSQTQDNIIWSSLQAIGNLDSKTSYAFKPIFRFNENVSGYQNMSIDISMRRKWGSGFYTQLVSRTWFIPSESERQFVWIDMGYSKNISKLNVTSFVRWHKALDINERIDPDFLRWNNKFTYPISNKIKLSIVIEPWLRLNGFEEFQRIRYESIIGFALSDKVNLSLGYRREIFLGQTSGLKFNHFLPNLAYKI